MQHFELKDLHQWWTSTTGKKTTVLMTYSIAAASLQSMFSLQMLKKRPPACSSGVLKTGVFLVDAPGRLQRRRPPHQAWEQPSWVPLSHEPASTG